MSGVSLHVEKVEFQKLSNRIHIIIDMLYKEDHVSVRYASVYELDDIRAKKWVGKGGHHVWWVVPRIIEAVDLRYQLVDEGVATDLDDAADIITEALMPLLDFFGDQFIERVGRGNG